MKNLAFLALILASCSTARQPMTTSQSNSDNKAFAVWKEKGGSGSEDDFLRWLEVASSRSTTAALTASTSFDFKDSFEKYTGYINVLDLGVTHSNDAAKVLTAYINSAPINTAISLFFPPGNYYFKSTLELFNHTVSIKGSGIARTIIYVDKGLTGIFINRTPGGIMNDFILEGFHILANGKDKSESTGIRLWQRGQINNVAVTGFSGYGIHVDGYIGGNNQHDASFCRLNNIFITNCGLDGLLVDGKDGNAGSYQNIDSRNNGGWGIRESSFLGNNYISCMTHANKLGPFKVDHPTSCSVFMGCYAEGDQKPSEFPSTNVKVIGGLHAAGIKGGQVL